MTTLLIFFSAVVVGTSIIALLKTAKQRRDHNKILDGICPDCGNALVQTECYYNDKDNQEIVTEYLCTCCGNRFEIIDSCKV